MALIEGVSPSAATRGRPPVLMTCRVCEEAKPSRQMTVYRGRKSTVCKACTQRRKQASERARLAMKETPYPCPGCERYQACVTAWTPCEAFKAWVEAAA